MAETYSGDHSSKNQVMRKIFDQIEKEKNENEYNRTEIQDRTNLFDETLQRFQYDINQSGAIRLIEVQDTSSKTHSSYHSK